MWARWCLAGALGGGRKGLACSAPPEHRGRQRPSKPKSARDHSPSSPEAGPIAPVAAPPLQLPVASAADSPGACASPAGPAPSALPALGWAAPGGVGTDGYRCEKWVRSVPAGGPASAQRIGPPADRTPGRGAWSPLGRFLQTTRSRAAAPRWIARRSVPPARSSAASCRASEGSQTGSAQARGLPGDHSSNRSSD